MAAMCPTVVLAAKGTIVAEYTTLTFSTDDMHMGSSEI